MQRIQIDFFRIHLTLDARSSEHDNPWNCWCYLFQFFMLNLGGALTELWTTRQKCEEYAVLAKS